MPALDRPEARADPELFGTALITAADLAAGSVDIAIALRLAEQAVALARQAGADRLLIDALATLSSVSYLAGDPERGLAPGREAVRRARQLGDDVLLGESLTNYLVWDALIDTAQAWQLFAEAIACTSRSGDHLYASYVNNQAAVYALRAGDLPAARAYLHQAARAMEAIGDKGKHVSVNLGWVLRQDSDPGGARSSFEAAIRMSRRNGERSGTAYATLGLACLAADEGDWRRAAVLHGVAQNFLNSTGQPWEDLEAGYRRDSLDRVRAQLGPEQFEQAYAQGMALSFDDALRLACARAVPA
jgi:tetratricopeptide (TPR) repeat protein